MYIPTANPPRGTTVEFLTTIDFLTVLRTRSIKIIRIKIVCEYSFLSPTYRHTHTIEILNNATCCHVENK